MTKNRCSTLVLSLAIGAFLICAATAQAVAAAGPVASHVTASVRAVQPAVSGLFQVKAPRVWTNGAPEFLNTWDAFQSRTSSASMDKAYAFTTVDSLTHQVLYAGLERASSKSPVVFEFSQLEGSRSVGDLRIEVEIDNAGSIGTVQFQSYADGGKGLKLIPIAILAGEGCSDAGTACVTANGASLEVGANLSQLLNGSGGFKAVKITTPEDSVVGTFTGISDGCLAEVFGKKVNCTANDVRLTAIVGTPNVTEACGPQFCTNNATLPCRRNADCPGSTCNFDSMTFTAVGRFTSGPARYDVGIYISTDDDANGDFSQTGSCTRFSFEANTVNHDGDQCGDTDAASTQDVAFGPVTVKCNDANGDGAIDIVSCETWGNAVDEIPGAKAACTGPNDVRVGTPSKCFCDLLPICVAVADNNSCDTEECRVTCSATSTDVCDPTSATACNNVPTNCKERVVHIPVTNGTVCGADPDPANPCDVNRTCQAGACTGTGFASSTTLCRAANGQCDVLESCTGTSAICPADGFASATTTCVGTSNGGACDGTDSCAGTTNTCVDGFLPVTTTCRPSAGICDPLESCTGNSGACPTDRLYQTADNIQCRGVFNECDAPEICDGSGPGCPADYCGARVLRVNTYTCTPPAP